MVVIMSVRICGHEVRWQKPIKVYTLTKASCIVLMLTTLAITPVFASHPPQDKASTGVATPCLPLEKSGMSAPATQKVVQHRTQRSAGTPSAPALALALALGLRNIPGPMEQSGGAQARNRATVPETQQQAFLLQGDGACPYKSSSMLW